MRLGDQQVGGPERHERDYQTQGELQCSRGGTAHKGAASRPNALPGTSSPQYLPHHCSGKGAHQRTQEGPDYRPPRGSGQCADDAAQKSADHTPARRSEPPRHQHPEKEFERLDQQGGDKKQGQGEKGQRGEVPGPRHAEGKGKENERAAETEDDGDQPAQHGQMEQNEEEELGPAQDFRSLNECGFLENRLPRGFFGQPALETVAQRFAKAAEAAQELLLRPRGGQRILEAPGQIRRRERIHPRI